MATYYAYQNGNINGDTTWADTNNYPTSGSIVSGATALAGTHTLQSNNYSVDINADFTAAEINNTGGGGFTVSTARTITTNVKAITNTCLVPSGTNTLTINGKVSGGTANAIGLNTTSNMAVVINAGAGNTVVEGGSANGAIGAVHNSTATLTITGNVIGGSGGNANGVSSTGSGAITVYGNVTAGAVAGRGIYATVAAVVVNGDVSAAAGTSDACYAGGGTTVNSGNIINTTTASAMMLKFIWNPLSGNYMKFRKSSGGVGDLYAGLTYDGDVIIENSTPTGAAPEAGNYRVVPFGNVESGVKFGPIVAGEGSLTGTYAGGGSGINSLIGPGGLIG